MTLPGRFWAKVDKNGPVPPAAPGLGPCWIWTAAKNPRTGYGAFNIGDHRVNTAHVLAWVDENGLVPQGQELDHLCRVRHCCRPSHLEPVTHAENVRRGLAPSTGAAFQLAKTHCPQGHPYDAPNTATGRGRRSCRACARLRSKARRF